MSEELRPWLKDELDRRSWSHNELARRAGVSQFAVSSVVNGSRNAGCEFCIKIALALSEPPEKVLRLANILPPLPDSPDDKTLTEIIELARNLPPAQRDEALRYLRYLYQNRRQ